MEFIQALHNDYKQTLTKLFTLSWRMVYWFHSVHPSICPSIHLSVHPSHIMCLLCNSYSSGWILSIMQVKLVVLAKYCNIYDILYIISRYQFSLLVYWHVISELPKHWPSVEYCFHIWLQNCVVTWQKSMCFTWSKQCLHKTLNIPNREISKLIQAMVTYTPWSDVLQNWFSGMFVAFSFCIFSKLTLLN